ncbi:hypothetical protein [Aliivibrio fischeri]|uniref:hypothetical protein n=1 Tax=Aliivibrio fischeri TaxID=668 RepID=UPI0007C47308|nr:hypothetical protein [Aliivibrio fischeri]
MKFRSFIYVFLAGICGVFFGGLILGFLFDLLFTNWVETGSTTFGNWAMWTGSLFSGIAACGAVFAANFTRQTLKFLTKQHDEQQNLQKIQMYQIHKEEFYNLLDELEKNHQHSFEFVERATLYREIFNPRGFAEIKTNVCIKDNTSALFFIVGAYERFQESQSYSLNQNFHDQIENMLVSYESLLKTIHIVFKNKQRIGNISNKKQRVIVNLLDRKKYLTVGTDVINSILEFTGNLPFNKAGHKVTTLEDPLTDYAFNLNNSNRYNLNLSPDSNQILNTTYRLYNLLRSTELNHLKKERLRLLEFWNDIEFIENNLNGENLPSMLLSITKLIKSDKEKLTQAQNIETNEIHTLLLGIIVEFRKKKIESML